MQPRGESTRVWKIPKIRWLRVYCRDEELVLDTEQAGPTNKTFSGQMIHPHALSLHKNVQHNDMFRRCECTPLKVGPS